MLYRKNFNTEPEVFAKEALNIKINISYIFMDYFES